MPIPKRTRNKDGTFRKKRSDAGTSRGYTCIEHECTDETARKKILLKQLQDVIFSSAKTERLQREFEGNLCGFLNLDDLPVTMDTYIDVRQGCGKFIIDINTIEKIILEAKKDT